MPERKFITGDGKLSIRTKLNLLVGKSVPLVSAALAGSYAADQDYGTACAFAGLAAAGVAIDYRDDVKIFETTMQTLSHVFEAGFAAGLSASQGINAENAIRFNLPEEGAVLYSSVDGTRQIADIEELMHSLGQTPESAATRVMIVAEHSRKRHLSTEEVETLRRGRALLNLAEPRIKANMCEQGKEVVATMDKVIANFEERYYQDHPEQRPSSTISTSS